MEHQSEDSNKVANKGSFKTKGHNPKSCAVAEVPDRSADANGRELVRLEQGSERSSSTRQLTDRSQKPCRSFAKAVPDPIHAHVKAKWPIYQSDNRT
jgi:hypothetical protein